MEPQVAQQAEAIDLKSIQCEFESHLADQKLIERLIKYIRIENQCAIWTGAITKSNGYGKIKYKFKSYDVHRLIGILVYGNCEMICHTNDCTNRACIRLKHLYAGDRSSNTLDAIMKGTHNSIQGNKRIRF